MAFFFPNKSAHGGIIKRAARVGVLALVICFAVWMRLDNDALDNSPLAEAVERNDVYTASALLQGGADPNCLFTFTNRPIRSAFWHSAVNQCEWLRGIAASFDRPQRESLLWLTAKSYQNETEIARLLLKYGSDPNLAGNDADTALMQAAGDGNAAFVKLLLASGANVNQPGANGQTALPHVIGSASVYNLEIERRYQNSHNGKSDNSGHNYSETLRLLVTAGANPNTLMVGGETPLHYARRHSLYDFVTPLTKAGAK